MKQTSNLQCTSKTYNTRLKYRTYCVSNILHVSEIYCIGLKCHSLYTVNVSNIQHNSQAIPFQPLQQQTSTCNTVLKNLRFNLAKREKKTTTKRTKATWLIVERLQITSEGRKIVADTYYTFGLVFILCMNSFSFAKV